MLLRTSTCWVLFLLTCSLLLLAATLVFFAQPPIVTADTLQEGNLTVIGQLRNVAGEPLAGVDVEIYTRPSCLDHAMFVQRSVTDEAGQFELSRVGAGWYTLEVDAMTVDTVAYAPLTQPIDVSATLPSQNQVELVAQEGGRIKGRAISATDNQPLSGVTAYLFKEEQNAWGETYWLTNKAMRIGADGRYAFEGLAAGTYAVSLHGYPYGSAEGIIDQTVGGAQTIAYRPTDPTRIEIVPEQTIDAGDTVIQKGPVIRGRIDRADGRSPLAYVKILVHRVNEAGDLEMFTAATTLSDGTYQTPGLPSGQYVLWFDTDKAFVSDDMTEYVEVSHDMQFHIEDAQPFQVGESDVEVAVTLSRGATIQGALFDDTGNSVPSARVKLFDENNRLIKDVNSDGAMYTMRGIPAGTYRVLFDNAWVTTPSWRSDAHCGLNFFGGHYFPNASTAEAATQVTVAGTQTVEAIDGIVTLNAEPVEWPFERLQTIQGQVVRQDEMPLAGVSLLIDGEHVGESSADGTYQLTVPTGRYLLSLAHPATAFMPTHHTLIVAGRDYRDIDFLEQHRLLLPLTER